MNNDERIYVIKKASPCIYIGLEDFWNLFYCATNVE
jgi:hypothetical protein